MGNYPTSFTNERRELLTICMEVKRGNYLFCQGEEADELYIIRSGKVQLSKVTSDGHDLSMRVCGKDDIVRELTLFCTPAKYMLSTKVVKDRKVAGIYKNTLEAKLTNNSTKEAWQIRENCL